MTEKQAKKLEHGTKMAWSRDGEFDIGTLIHDPKESFIKWSDGQKTYLYDDLAMKHVRLASITEAPGFITS